MVLRLSGSVKVLASSPLVRQLVRVPDL